MSTLLSALEIVPAGTQPLSAHSIIGLKFSGAKTVFARSRMFW